MTGRDIHRIRWTLGVTRSRLAELCHVHPTTIGRNERRRVVSRYLDRRIPRRLVQLLAGARQGAAERAHLLQLGLFKEAA